ncbi:hypothetical protein ACVH9Z_34290 [Rhodococcus opacus]|uniref:hypothetical protein n=1 Tax=Rhodococcus opacus TaxID=37919 RepID=UPI001B30D523|nr:hypothetical protein [Rhodococcus opacus]
MTPRHIEMQNAHARYENRKARKRAAQDVMLPGVRVVRKCKCPKTMPDAGIHLDGRAAALCVLDGWDASPTRLSAFIEGDGKFAFATDAPGYWAVSLYLDLEDAQAHQLRFVRSGHAGDARHHVLDLRAMIWEGSGGLSGETLAMMLGVDDDDLPIM